MTSGAVFARAKGAISLNAVTTTATGSVVPGRHGRVTRGYLETGTGVSAGTAKLQGAMDALFPGTPVELDSVDLATVGASNVYATPEISQRFAFYRWITTGGAHNGAVTGYIQHYR